jgi:hypothetical protein
LFDEWSSKWLPENKELVDYSTAVIAEVTLLLGFAALNGLTMQTQQYDTQPKIQIKGTTMIPKRERPRPLKKYQ